MHAMGVSYQSINPINRANESTNQSALHDLSVARLATLQKIKA
jgi:hypothetical protein